MLIRLFTAAAMEEIVEAVRLEEEVAVRGWFDCFQNNKQCFRYRTLLGLGVNFMQQVSVAPCRCQHPGGPSRG